MASRRFDKPVFDIAPVLEHYGVSLPARRGGWTKVRCFLHDDSNASAAVSFDANRFVCYAGCTDPRGEDSVGLIQHVEQCDFKAAVEEAERITGQSHQRVQRKRRTGSSLFAESWNSD